MSFAKRYRFLNNRERISLQITLLYTNLSKNLRYNAAPD